MHADISIAGLFGPQCVCRESGQHNLGTVSAFSMALPSSTRARSHCCLARMVRADMHACGEPHEVYCQKFWMKHWGHPNPKHSIMWSTSPLIRMLYLGKLIGDQRRSQYKSAVAYKDSRGRKKYKGTKDLKRTGLLVLSTLHVLS